MYNVIFVYWYFKLYVILYVYFVFKSFVFVVFLKYFNCVYEYDERVKIYVGIMIVF